MLPLTGAKRRKYFADLENKKGTDGYVSSDPAGVQQWKLKRKDLANKEDVEARGMDVEIDNVDAVGDGVLNSQNVSPQPKRVKMGKGADTGRTRSTPVRGGKYVGVGSTSLNAQATKSFWHSEFDFRRCESFV